MGPIANTVYVMLQLYLFVLFARVLVSWFPDIDPYNPIIRFLYEITEPILQPIREFMRKQFPDMAMLDLSPMVVFFGIFIMQSLLSGVPI